MAVKLLTTSDVAARATVTPDWVRKAIRSTDPNAWPPPLAAARIGKKFVIKESDADKWLERIFADSPA